MEPSASVPVFEFVGGGIWGFVLRQTISSVVRPIRGGHKPPRNALCSCGCGRKIKKCRRR